MPDKLYLQMIYHRNFHRYIDWNAPQTFNEKLNWLKIYDRNPFYSIVVDKYAVKEYVSNKIGEQYVIPTYGVWDDFDSIDFNKLPNQFVLKGTHDSGSVVICYDKEHFNKHEAKINLDKSLSRNLFWNGREYPYKTVKPRIIAEKLLGEDTRKSLTDYKFFCFDGYVDNVMLCLDRDTGDTKFYFFNQKWELLRINKRGLAAPDDFTLPKPNNMDKMFELAEVLSKGFPFSRIDLYNVNGKIYFGEITLYPNGGFDNNLLPETDLYLGSLINLPEREKHRMEK